MLTTEVTVSDSSDRGFVSVTELRISLLMNVLDQPERKKRLKPKFLVGVCVLNVIVQCVN
jgi:hypothetical protein